MPSRKYTSLDLANAVKESKSIAGALRRLGLVPIGGNYRTLKKLVASRDLDTSHWTGQAHRRGSRQAVVATRPLAEILCDGVFTNSNRLRKRLLREGVMPPVCAICRLSEWRGQAIPLELDHRDGNPTNNRLANLRLLCPNCHAQTPNYRGKNKLRRDAGKAPRYDSPELCPGGGMVDTRDLND